MTLKRVRSWLLPVLATILTIVVLGAALAPRLLDLDTYKAQIIAQVKSSLKRDLRYDSGAFTMRLAPAFTFTGVTIKEKDGVTDFASADRLTVRIAILPLLRGKLVLSRIQLEHPTVSLWRDRRGGFNISDMLTPSGGEGPGIRKVELKKARIRFADYFFSDKPVVTELSDTDLELSRIVRGKDCDFKLSGKLASGNSRVPIELSGVAEIPAAGAPASSMPIHGRIKTGPVDVGHFWPYYSRYVPFKSLAGQLALDATLKGRLNAFKAKTEFRFTGLNLDYPQVFHARLTPRLFKGACALELTERSLAIDDVKAEVDGFKVGGKVKLSDLHSGDMRITAEATTNSFDLRNYRQYIPYGIIVDDTSRFIEQKITGGVYRLNQGRLDGRVSQILHMERGQNYNVLYIKAHVEDGTVNYGSGIPAFTGIKGQLELSGKDFILKGMTGRFGTSPLSLDGRITDYPLTVPCRYLFAAKVQPRQPEVVWLLGKGIGSFATNTILNLKGEGTTSLYRLSGDSDLTAASYSFKDLVAKPAGRANSVSFAMEFDKEQFRITSLTYRLPPVVLSAAAASRYNGPVSFVIRTNRFQSADVGALVPMVRQYRPAGQVQLLLKAAGPDLDRLSWSGSVGLAGVTVKPAEKTPLLTGVTGTVAVNGETMETSQLQVRLGTTSLTGRGVVTGFKNPSWQVVFSSPSVNPADLGYVTRVPLRLEHVQGNLTYQNDDLQIASLSGTLGKSTLQLKGSVKDFKRPTAELQVHAGFLDLGDLAPLFLGGRQGESHLTLRAHLTAADGKFNDFPFRRLRTSVFYDDGVLQLLPFEFSSFEGEVTGRLRSEFNETQPHHALSCSAQKVSSDRLLHALGVKTQQVTGLLSLQAELSGRGSTGADLKRSVQGNVTLRIERGTVRRFATLSKIFSILNVSQLFKGQLPDMVSGGMPFNKITGDIAFTNGVASSKNLFLDSNAMNVSAVGKVDLGRDQMDVNVGVQPLQTVDKVVSRIPIVGWILTGKDRSLITTYFEAKGSIENPQVTAVPVKSMAKGVLNIFKRVFELPARLITDTGEVVIGR